MLLFDNGQKKELTSYEVKISTPLKSQMYLHFVAFTSVRVGKHKLNIVLNTV